MAEYIERGKVAASLSACETQMNRLGIIACQFIKATIDAIPAADVRPVVLCRDCIYCRRVDEFEYWCDGFCSPARLVRTDDFCSHGKRKERLT